MKAIVILALAATASVVIVSSLPAAPAVAAAPEPTPSTAFIKVPYSSGYAVYERCVDGVTYLVTDRGSITAKLKSGLNGAPILVECK